MADRQDKQNPVLRPGSYLGRIIWEYFIFPFRRSDLEALGGTTNGVTFELRQLLSTHPP